MAQAVSCRPLTAKASVRFQASSCEICGGQSDSGTSFFSQSFCFPLSLSFHQCVTLLPVGKVGEVWEPSKEHPSLDVRDHWIEKYFSHFFLFLEVSGYSPPVAAWFNGLPYLSPPKQAKRALTLKFLSWVSHKYQSYPEIIRVANKREISWLLTVENVLLLKPTKEYDVWVSHSGKYGGSWFLGNVGILCQAARRHIADDSNLQSVMCN
jgi:hypothetical protein